MAELLQTVDLSKSTPAGWTLVGFSAVKSDGVNPYRVVGTSTQINFSTTTPQYVRYQLQLFSLTQDITATVRLDGQSLGEFHFTAGKFMDLYPAGFVGTGQHTLIVEQSCAANCEIHQYHAQAQFYSVEAATRAVGYNAQNWLLDAPDSALTDTGLSGVQFDGNNFYRTLSNSQPATITFPAGIRPTNLHYLTQADHGAYKLTWMADGKALAIRHDLKTEWLPAGQSANQNVPLVGQNMPKQLQVSAQCQDGGTDCFPIRLFFIEVTGVPAQTGLSNLSAPKQVLGMGLCVLLCVLTAWFLRPWKSVAQGQG